jgi:hypothetical protein
VEVSGLDLSDVATCELCKELEKREGVTHVWINPYDKYIVDNNGWQITDLGPASIFIVID